MSETNKPTFILNKNLLTKLELHLEINNSTEIYYKEGGYDNVGSSGYIFNLFNTKEEEIKYCLKITEKTKESELEKVVSLLTNKLNLSFFPKFVHIEKITNSSGKEVYLEKFNLHCMEYVGESVARLIEKNMIHEKQFLIILLQILDIVETLEKSKLFYFDLHSRNVCIKDGDVYLVDLESLRVITSSTDIFENIESFGLDIIQLMKENSNELEFKTDFKKLFHIKDIEEMKTFIQFHLIEFKEDISEIEFQSLSKVNNFYAMQKTLIK